jgi:hypothetical protein
VDRAVVVRRGHGDAGLFKFAGVGFALIAERVGESSFMCYKRRRRRSRREQNRLTPLSCFPQSFQRIGAGRSTACNRYP